MTFRIHRVSDRDAKPCKNAYLAEEEREACVGRIRDENGKIILQRKIMKAPYWEIKIESLEDLIRLQKEVKNELIVDVEKGKIVIYDGYIE